MGKISKRYNNSCAFSNLKPLKCTARIICSNFFIIHFPLTNLSEDVLPSVLDKAMTDKMSSSEKMFIVYKLTITIASKSLSVPLKTILHKFIKRP